MKHLVIWGSMQSRRGIGRAADGKPLTVSGNRKADRGMCTAGRVTGRSASLHGSLHKLLQGKSLLFDLPGLYKTARMVEMQYNPCYVSL